MRINDALEPNTLVMGGRFKILRHIGGGGMSEVYLAEQISLGRKVALKVLKKDLHARSDMTERFRREALILSTVDHPAVVRVIDFDASGDVNILVLELAEGETLEHVLKQGALPKERALPILAQLAEGLGAIHEKGIIHRDIKPQNVVLTPSPRGGEQARLLDFGIARLMELSAPPTPGLMPSLDGPEVNPFVSTPGQVVGTPAFVAPEQATARPLSAQTDVYAFGVLAFRVLSGAYPFPGPGSRDFMIQHVNAAPRPLGEAAPQLAGETELVNLVMQCLEKKPEARPKDGHALFETLLKLLPQGNPLDTSTTTPSRRIAATAAAAPAAPEVKEHITSQLEKLLPTFMPLAQAAAASLMRVWHGVTHLDPRWRKSLAITFGLLVLMPVGWALRPETPVERAGRLLAQGKASEALEVVKKALPDRPADAPELWSLHAAALHRLGRNDEEREILTTYTYQALHAAHPLLLEALAEDYGQAETDDVLRELIAVVPDSSLRPAFEAFATGPRSRKQWGALRYLDFAGKHQRLDRVALYSQALHDADCGVRAAAAVRLSALGDPDAIEHLRTLSELPKEESSYGRLNCGQDEAAEAIRQLKKPSK
jgi:serine/threonine protein kinase